ncbi:GNAT family N-acetyltransferase [Rhodoligotrophos defluvii]|uniref:GNAT family N-acetyltransferase n=1 Tax=Rhodoligotrophos defluvii TaxID=2561934 RepID=UPI0010C9D5F4|nr:GNAT family N-acetyltransferase [Rhodoligotrophos defluvii]
MDSDARGIVISEFSADDLARRLSDFAALLHACVHAGASVSFVLPFSLEDSEAFWRGKVLPAMRRGGMALLAAQHGDAIAGSVQLDHDTSPNQPHRAEVRKLLVHPAFRRQGIARALMAELEGVACRLGRSLLTLDTRTGDHGEPLYAGLGYRTVGVIPNFSRHAIDGRLEATTIMYKLLA